MGGFTSFSVIINSNLSLIGKCNVRQIYDFTMTLMTSHVGDVVVKTLEDRCGWCIISGCKFYQCDYCEIFKQYLYIT